MASFVLNSWKKFMFSKTWGWINDKISFIFGWTTPLKEKNILKLVFKKLYGNK